MNMGRIRRHGIEPEDAEAALLDPQRVKVGAYRRGGESRSA
jgi:hypothetical protein